jgi:ketosteroid isomerase-like protein
MSAALELVKIALQAYGTGDCEITMQLSDPLIRWDERASRPDGDLVWGQDEVLKAMRQYQGGWEEYRFEVEKIAEVGSGRIVGLCRERGRTEDDLPVDRRYGGLWVVEDGKIVSWATYLTPREAVKAARELAGGRFTPARQGPEAAESKGDGRLDARPGPPKPEPRKPEQPQPASAEPAPFDEKRREAARRRAALAKAAREGARRTSTA